MIQRKSSRLLVLNPEDEILLIKAEDWTVREPGQKPEGIFWFTPGGSLEPGETHEMAGHRELWEELRIKTQSLVGPIWWQEHVLQIGEDLVHQTDQFFIVRVDSNRFDAHHDTGLAKSTTILEVKWWSMESLARSTERILPIRFHEYLSRLLRNGIPASMIDISARADK